MGYGNTQSHTGRDSKPEDQIWTRQEEGERAHGKRVNIRRSDKYTQTQTIQEND